MQIQRIDKPTPVIIIDDFLPKDKAAECLEECIALERIFMPAAVLDAQSGSVVNEKMRKNEVVYLDSVFSANEKKSKIIQNVLRNGVFSPEAMKVWEEGNTGFELINRCTRSENVLSRYGNGDFYGFHRDWNATKANRLITVVYYCHTESGQFAGGNLLLRGTPENLSVAPKHNRLVAFNSGAYHSVEAVNLSSDKFSDGRFSVNMWLGFRS